MNTDPEIKYRLDLWKLIEGIKNPKIVEVGVAESRFSNGMLYWPIECEIHLVDLWQTIPTQSGDAGNNQAWHDANFRMVSTAKKAFPDRVFIHRGDSAETAKEFEDASLDMVYLDAWHEYPGVKRDAEAWFPKIKPGGAMAGHDYLNEKYGVKRAIDEFAAAKGLTVNVIPDESKYDASFWMRL